MKNLFNATFIALSATVLLLFSYCTIPGSNETDCVNVAGDLSLQALERADNNTTAVGDTFKIRCVIQNVAGADLDCPTVVSASEGYLEIGYSAVYSDKFSDYVVTKEGSFEIKELEATDVQKDIVSILPDKKGWYAVQVKLNTGGSPVKEITPGNNVKAVAVEVK